MGEKRIFLQFISFFSHSVRICDTLLHHLNYLLITLCKDGLNKGQKWYEPNRSRRYQEEVARIQRRIVQKVIFTTQIIMMV